MHVFAFDSDAFQQLAGLHLAPGPVEKHGLAFDAECPTDLDTVMSFASSIVPIDSGWRLYYGVRQHDPLHMGIGVAESADGLNWTRLALGQVTHEGQDTSRLKVDGLPDDARITQPQVVRRPDGRWLMYFWLHAQHEGYIRYLIAESDDGLCWSLPSIDRFAILHPADCEVGQNGWVAGLTAASPKDKFGHKRTLDWLDAKRLRSNDATYVYYNPALDQFEMYSVWLLPNSQETGRYIPHDNAPRVTRTIHRRVSAEGYDWGAPELIIVPDEHDPLDMQFYYLSVHPDRDWSVGFLGHYRCWAQTMDIEVCFSPDGRRWQRPLRGAWLPRDPVPELGCMSAYAPNCLIDRGDDWLMLYTAGNTKHNHELPPGVEKPWRGVMAATVAKDRYAGLSTAPGIAARATLRPFIPATGRVTVNAVVRGALRAELCDPFGRPFPGYEMDAAVPITGDSAAHELRWEGGKTTEPYQFDPVTLRLELRDADLYAITA